MLLEELSLLDDTSRYGARSNGHGQEVLEKVEFLGPDEFLTYRLLFDDWRRSSRSQPSSKLKRKADPFELKVFELIRFRLRLAEEYFLGVAKPSEYRRRKTSDRELIASAILNCEEASERHKVHRDNGPSLVYAALKYDRVHCERGRISSKLLTVDVPDCLRYYPIQIAAVCSQSPRPAPPTSSNSVIEAHPTFKRSGVA